MFLINFYKLSVKIVICFFNYFTNEKYIMEKKFLYLVKFFLIVCISSGIYAMEVHGEITFDGGTVFSWKAKGPGDFCQGVEKNFAATHEKCLTIASPTNEEVVYIYLDGKFTINPGQDCIVENKFNKILLNTKENNEKQFSKENSQGKQKQLQPGSKITLSFSDAESITVTYNNNRSRVASNNEIEELPVGVQAKLLALKKNDIEHSWKRELKTLIYNSLKEGTKKNRVNPTTLDWLKELEDQKLKRTPIVENILGEIIRPVSEVLLEWDPGEVIAVKFAARGTMIIIKHEEFMEIKDLKSKSLKQLLFVKDAKQIDCNSDGTRVIIQYQDGRWEIRNLKNNELLFAGDNIKKINWSPDSIWAIIQYQDGSWKIWKIINLKDNELLFASDTTDNIQCIIFNPDGTEAFIVYKNKLIIKDLRNKNGEVFEALDTVMILSLAKVFIIQYKNGRAEIRNLKDKEIIFAGDSIERIECNPDETMAIVKCKDNKRINRGRIINLKNGNKLLERYGIVWIELNLGKTIAKIQYKKRGSWEIVELEKKNKVLFLNNHTEWVDLSADGTKAIIEDKGGLKGLIKKKIIGKWQLINLKKMAYPVKFDTEDINEEEFSRDRNIKSIELSPDKTMAKIQYNKPKGKWRVISLENNEEFFNGSGIRGIDFNLNKIITIKHKSGINEIVDLDTKKTLFSDNHVSGIEFNSDGTSAIVKYEKGALKVINLAGYNRGIVYTELTPEQLLLTFYLNKNSNGFYIVEDKKNSHLNKIWNSFDRQQQEKLKELYFY